MIIFVSYGWCEQIWHYKYIIAYKKYDIYNLVIF